MSHWDDLPDRILDEIDNDRYQWDEFKDNDLNDVLNYRDQYLEQQAIIINEEQEHDEEDIRRQNALKYEEEYIKFVESNGLKDFFRNKGCFNCFNKLNIDFWLDKVK